MTAVRPLSRSHALGRPGAVRAVALIAGCVALAALSLLAPSMPSFDPFAWLVWGRELTSPSMTFAVEGGPSWKPLPVVATTLLSLAGGAAPALWLLVARAGLLLALAGAFRLGQRLAGPWAGAIAAVAVLTTETIVQFAWRGASEPLLLACVLWAVERQLAGRREAGFWLWLAAGLLRPEAWPFLGLAAISTWRGDGRAARTRVAAGLALVPLLWFGVPALGGSAFNAGDHAAGYNGNTGGDPGWTALRRGLELAPAPVWILGAAAVALRRRNRAVRWLALVTAGWLAIVVVMTIAGFPGLARFMLPAAALACVLAGVGAVWLVQRAAASRREAGVAAAGVLLVAGVALSWGSLRAIPAQVRFGIRAAHVQEDLADAIDAAGGRAAVLSRGCGRVASNRSARTTLAWDLRVPLERVRAELSRPGVAFAAPPSQVLSTPPAVLVPAPHRRIVLARAGVWRVVAILSPAGAPGPACRGGVRPPAQNPVP